MTDDVLPFFANVRKDFDAQLQGRNGIGSKLSAALFARGFHLLLAYRMQRACSSIPVAGQILSKVLFYVTACVTGCEISPRARLAGGIYIPHPNGIIIGESSIIGGGTVIYHQVTIGQKTFNDRENPRIGENVYVGAGAKIIGGITIGAHAKVGANSVVTRDVPEHSTVVGIPARVIPRADSAGITEAILS